jgi:hypothetical protein
MVNNIFNVKKMLLQTNSFKVVNCTEPFLQQYFLGLTFSPCLSSIKGILSTCLLISPALVKDSNLVKRMGRLNLVTTKLKVGLG